MKLRFRKATRQDQENPRLLKVPGTRHTMIGDVISPTLYVLEAMSDSSYGPPDWEVVEVGE